MRASDGGGRPCCWDLRLGPKRRADLRVAVIAAGNDRHAGPALAAAAPVLVNAVRGRTLVCFEPARGRRSARRVYGPALPILPPAPRSFHPVAFFVMSGCFDRQPGKAAMQVIGYLA